MRLNRPFFIGCLLFNTIQGFAAEADTTTLEPIAEPEFSVMEDRIKSEDRAEENPYVLTFYRPTYILPYYYTGSPFHRVYQGDTPEDQAIQSSEFKGQLSFKMPLWKNIMGKDLTLSTGYTQTSYWQVYTKSQYFRETNYEPELFFTHQLQHNLVTVYGINHQSNGRGGLQERSWNRAYAGFTTSKYNWLFGLKAWTLIFKSSTADKHNPDITKYLGHEEFLSAYKLGRHTFSLTARNLEHIHYSAYQASWSYQLGPRLNLYIEGFSGYGQSLIEYNHHTNSFGIGMALSNWI